MKENQNRVYEEADSTEEKEVEELKNVGSDDEWQPEAEAGGMRKRPSRTSGRTSYAEDRLSEDDLSDEDEGGDAAPAAKRGRGRGRGGRGRGRGSRGGRGRGRGGRGAKAKSSGSDDRSADEDNPPAKDEECDDSSMEESEDEEPAPPQYQSGNFVVLKKEYDEGGVYPLWKIDGKSLLQKFVPSEENGEKSYVSTTIYAGWSKACIEKYYPAVVKPIKQDGRDHYVKLEKAEKADDKES